MKLFVNVHHDVRLLPLFLDHYEARGVTEFFVAVTPEFSVAADRLATAHPVTVYSELDVAESLVGTASISEMRRRHQRRDEWAVICDLDEFVEGDDLRAVAGTAERSGANLVRGVMHDRFGANGQPQGPSGQVLLCDEYPIKSRFIREVMHGCDHKGVLVKGHLAPAPRAAHHWFDDELAFAEALEISHYKWTSGSVERLRRNYADARRRGVEWAEEYRRALEHYERHGRFAWELFGGRHSRDFVPEPPPQCSFCGGVIWEAELRYSLARYGAALCRTHQHSAVARAPVVVD